MTHYPYDPDHLARTAALLYAHVPEFYKRRDRIARAAAPPQPAELEAIVQVLAAPLAAVRQSIEELYGDLFVDSAGDDVLAELAAGIALDLVFRDAGANRRDLRAAMARRRRKGTPAMLQEMAHALIDRQVATREGWKAVMLTQDLNLLRFERTTPDLRPAAIRDRAAGPLATLARSVDPRPITARSGQSHPRHMIHWAFLSRLHPLNRAACHRLPDGAGDLRFAFDAANAWRALRVRSTGIGDMPGTDRVPEGLFAESPADWHGRDGRFTVRLTSLPAAAGSQAIQRGARPLPADPALLTSPVGIELLETDGGRTSGAVEIELLALPLVGGMPDATAAVSRGRITVDRTGVVASAGGAGALPADPVAMLRLRPEAPAVSRLLGESVIAITGAGGTRNAVRAATDPALAESGYRRGALHVRIPAMRVSGPRWFYVAADGAVHAAGAADSGVIDRPLDLSTGNRRLPTRALAAPPVGPVWPEAAETADRRPFAPALAAHGAAPVPVHGLTVLRPTAAGSELPAGQRCALVFALTFFADVRVFAPMLRLVWDGPDPRPAVWEALDAAAAPTVDPAGRLAVLAEVLRQGRNDLAIALRFECETAGAVLTPGEIAFTAADGTAVLIHLPELLASAADVAAWPRGPAPLAAQSEALQVGADGSTWIAGTNRLRRRSVGSAVPLLAPAAMRRRRVAWRRLCPWQNETLIEVLDPTPPGRLDVDPRFGLFAIASAEPPVPHPPGPAAPPPPVTVDIQVGATLDIGALPVDRDRLLNRAPRTPTRLVSISGHMGAGTAPEHLALPLHRTLAEALAAIAANPAAEEIVRIVDSGFYGAEGLVWPAAPALRHLVIEAAAGERPMLEIAASTPGAAAYESLEVSGLALLPAAVPLDLVLPPSQTVTLAFLSVLDAGLTLTPQLLEAAGIERLAIVRSTLGPVTLAEAGEIAISDSILDAGALTVPALTAPEADLLMDRATVFGGMALRAVDISDAILAGEVVARERFRGCIRYSLLAPGGETPRKHRVIRTDAATGAPVQPPFLSRDRRDPAYLRLDPEGDARILTGASDGGEMGAFNGARLGELLAGLRARLAEHTPAGLRTGTVLRH